MPKGQFLAKTLAKTSLNPSLCLQALCVCVLHSRRDSFPETAGTKQVTVTLEENHRVQESIWQNACVCVWELDYFFRQWRRVWTCTDCPSKASLLMGLPVVAWKQWHDIHIQHDISSLVFWRQRSKRQTRPHVLIKRTQQRAVLLHTFQWAS